jgi:hypothetical protein
MPGNWAEEVHSLETTFVDISIVNEQGQLPNGTKILDVLEAASSQTAPKDGKTATERAPLESDIVRQHPFFTWKPSAPLIKEFAVRPEIEAFVEDDANEDDGSARMKGSKKLTRTRDVQPNDIGSARAQILWGCVTYSIKLQVQYRTRCNRTKKR